MGRHWFDASGRYLGWHPSDDDPRPELPGNTSVPGDGPFDPSVPRTAIKKDQDGQGASVDPIAEAHAASVDSARAILLPVQAEILDALLRAVIKLADGAALTQNEIDAIHAARDEIAPLLPSTPPLLRPEGASAPWPEGGS